MDVDVRGRRGLGKRGGLDLRMKLEIRIEFFGLVFFFLSRK